MTKGLLITIEGGEGSGKTTAAKSVVEKLKEVGYDAVYLREPGGNATAEKIRNIVVNEEGLDPYVQLLLFSAARACIVDDIKNAIDSGKIVVMDRYVLSTLVYQGRVGGIPIYQIKTLTNIATKSLAKPNIEFILDISAEEGLKRIVDNNRETNVFDKLNIDFHNKVNEAFRHTSYAQERYIINASKDKEEVFDSIIKYIYKYLINNGF